MSVMWLVYFLMHAYLRLILKNFEWMIEWILISGSVIIILYQIFSLFFRYPDKVYRNFTLFLVYFLVFLSIHPLVFGLFGFIVGRISSGRIGII